MLLTKSYNFSHFQVNWISIKFQMPSLDPAFLPINYFYISNSHLSHEEAE